MPEKTLSEVFGEIADAIREKNGSESAIKPINMAQEIEAIPTGPSREGYYYRDGDGQWGSFGPQTEYSTYCWDLGGYYEPRPIESGLIYVNTGSESPDPISLNEGSMYVYQGGSTFNLRTIPDWVYYDSQSGYLMLTDYTDSGAYYISEESPGEYNISPITGTSSITENGEYDVSNYASVNVQVSGPALNDGLYSVTQGSPSLCSRGVYYVDQYGEHGEVRLDGQTKVYEYVSESYFMPIAVGLYTVGSSGTDDVDDDVLLWHSSGEYCYQINLNTGSTYTYEGSSNFTPYEGRGFTPEQSGYYWYDSASGWYKYDPVPGNVLAYIGEQNSYHSYELTSDSIYKYSFNDEYPTFTNIVLTDGLYYCSDGELGDPISLLEGSTYVYSGYGTFVLQPDSWQEGDVVSYSNSSGFQPLPTGLYHSNGETQGVTWISFEETGASQIFEDNYGAHYKVIRID